MHPIKDLQPTKHHKSHYKTEEHHLQIQIVKREGTTQSSSIIPSAYDSCSSDLPSFLLLITEREENGNSKESLRTSECQ